MLTSLVSFLINDTNISAAKPKYNITSKVVVKCIIAKRYITYGRWKLYNSLFACSVKKEIKHRPRRPKLPLLGRTGWLRSVTEPMKVTRKRKNWPEVLLWLMIAPEPYCEVFWSTLSLLMKDGNISVSRHQYDRISKVDVKRHITIAKNDNLGKRQQEKTYKMKKLC